jgi:RNA recognition motif-containing protein
MRRLFAFLLRACVNVRSPMKLLIRNLARTTTESQLRTMFEAFGAVQSCNLVLDKISGASKGFAFIEMPRRGDAKAAVKSLNHKKIDNNTVRVKYAETPAKSKPPVSQ